MYINTYLFMICHNENSFQTDPLRLKRIPFAAQTVQLSVLLFLGSQYSER